MTHGTLFFEDFVPGQVYVTQSRTITESDLVAFAGWSWDTNPVHTDVASAADGRFGHRIAHGLLGMAVAMGLASRLGIFEGSSVALLGVEDWRFVRPIFIGDSICAQVEILSTRLTGKGDAGVLERRFTVVNHKGEVVQQGNIGLMVSTRPPLPTI